jgi:uncharacterized protein (DUF1015 family)
MTSDGLQIAPFRGLRYVPGRVSALAAVTSPPYDVVVRPEELRELETADPYNIVRLILPQSGDPADRHCQAAWTLRRWREDGVLAQDAEPALYVYEQRGGEVTQRGLIAALRLSPPEEGVVLPHEDVIPAVVDDRAALMRSTRANLEPLLLSYGGDRGEEGVGAAGVIERAVLGPPLLSTTTEDGMSHRLWAVTDPGEIGAAEADLAEHRALVADGHHRWATYLRLREEHTRTGTGTGSGTGTRADTGTGTGTGRGTGRDAGPDSGSRRNDGDSPWDWGLVLLVDSARYPLRVHPIHRVLPRLPLQRALRAVESAVAFRVTELGPSLPEALGTLERTPGNAYLLSDGSAFHLLDRPAPRLLASALDPERPAAWRRLDASVLHAALLDEVLRIPDRPAELGYLHDAEAALDKAARLGGTAVLMRAVDEGTVRRLAEAGIRMPRKSTSFGPKPATGFVVRALDDNVR